MTLSNIEQTVLFDALTVYKKQLNLKYGDPKYEAISSLRSKLKRLISHKKIEKPQQYNASIGQLICPYCNTDCGGFCEPGDLWDDSNEV